MASIKADVETRREEEETRPKVKARSMSEFLARSQITHYLPFVQQQQQQPKQLKRSIDEVVKKEEKNEPVEKLKKVDEEELLTGEEEEKEEVREKLMWREREVVLKLKNGHERDGQIVFYDEGHRYEVPSTGLFPPYVSVTTWKKKMFEEFNADAIITKMMSGPNWNPSHKYWGMTREEIKAQWEENRVGASTLGTQLHYAIELCLNCPELISSSSSSSSSYTHADIIRGLEEQQCKEVPEEDNGAEQEDDGKKEKKDKGGKSSLLPYGLTEENAKEWGYFLDYMRDHPEYRPYRTEWMVYDEETRLAGSIDMVYELPDGTLAVYDWKRAKDISQDNRFRKFAKNPLISHIPGTDFGQYAIQLNTYRYILEKRYGKVVSELCLVRFHSLSSGYEKIPVPLLDREMELLMQERIQQVQTMQCTCTREKK